MFLTTKKLEKSKVHLVASRNYHWNAEGARKCFQKRFPLFIDIVVVTKFFSVDYFVLYLYLGNLIWETFYISTINRKQIPPPPPTFKLHS